MDTGNIKHDLDSSIGNSKGQNEETVDDLIKKLNARGARVKILTADDVAQTPSQKRSDAHASLPATPQRLPGARRVFTLDIDQNGVEELFVAQNNQLTLYDMTQDLGVPRWSIFGPGVVQSIKQGNLSTGSKLVIAWGMGKGQMEAPLTLIAHDPQSGQGEVLWQREGSRPQLVDLILTNLDNDP